MANGRKTTQYPTSATDIGDNDLFDVSKKISTSPDVWETQKIPGSVVKAIGFKVYDSTKSYVPNQCTVYLGGLFRCITATTGAFDQTKWSSVTFFNNGIILNRIPTSFGRDCIAIWRGDFIAGTASYAGGLGSDVAATAGVYKIYINSPGAAGLGKLDFAVFPDGSIGVGFNTNASGGPVVAPAKFAVRVNSSAFSTDYAYGIYDVSNVRMFGVKNNGTLNIASVPTSSAGLTTGDIWSNSGILTIV